MLERILRRRGRTIRALGTAACYALPVALLAIFLYKGYAFPFSTWPFPDRSFDAPIVRRPSQIPVALAGLLAPLPPCLATSYWLRRGSAVADPVGHLMTQLAVLVAVELSVCLGLACLGGLTKTAFLAAEGLAALAGLAAMSPLAFRRVTDPGAGSSLGRALMTYSLLTLTLTSFGLVSVHLGRDNGRDMMSYHYYNGYAFVNQRHGFDLGVANMETYLNPLLDAAYYVLMRDLRPVWVGFVVGAAHGVSAVLLFGVSYEALGGIRAARGVRAPLALACAAAGVCEPMFLGLLGTSTHDDLTAAFPLAALWMIVRLLNRGPVAGPARAVPVVVSAGVLAGLSAGFKLTSGIYPIGMALGLLVTPPGWRRRFGLAAVFSAGVVAGFLTTNGSWMAALQARYGSPVFPLYNALFGSPYWADLNVSYLHITADLRWFDHLLMPFYLTETTNLLSETPSRDWALAFAYGLLLLVGLGRLVGFLQARWA